MPPVARALLSIVVGIAVALGGTWGSAQLADCMAEGSLAWLVRVAGRVVSTFAGATITAALVPARKALVATVVGLVMMSATFVTFVARPHPFWVASSSMCGVILAHLGARALILRREARDAEAH